MRMFERLIGLDLKLRQYEQGKAFCDAVVAAGGIDALNRAWASPDALPTLAELDAPEQWLERTCERPFALVTVRWTRFTNTCSWAILAQSQLELISLLHEGAEAKLMADTTTTTRKPAAKTAAKRRPAARKTAATRRTTTATRRTT